MTPSSFTPVPAVDHLSVATEAIDVISLISAQDAA
ncbi:hypothetical protein EDF20_1954 [Frigoribacterium sp. PhB116]|nr:hypothetical protein EDF18_2531 [Frigoribacterium sp. PhB107]TDT64457.1 hypothetical protein EDF20_1954 [Frigoribacterium sp. PhB116]